MNDQLKVALIQPELTWHKPEANFQSVASLISEIDETDLILLPEMWSSGYTMQAHKYHSSTARALELMQGWAANKKALVIGSLITQINDAYYNRLYIVSDKGVERVYDKKHLFGFAGEDRVFTSGSDQLIFEHKGWRICANICYDLRFPVWARNTTDYDVLLYVANWPNPRLNAWDNLLKARAIENQAYVLGANCYGKDAWNNEYSGHSAVIDSFGYQLTETIESSGVIRATLDKKHLAEARSKFPFLKDRDGFSLH